MRGDGDAVRVSDEILDAGVEPQLDVGMPLDRVAQDRLQVGTMDRPVGRAIALFGAGAERNAREHPSACGADLDRIRRNGMVGDLSAEPERYENARGVWRELEACSGFFQTFGLLKYDDAETRVCERQRNGQSADAGACDDDGAGGRHRVRKARPSQSPRIRADAPHADRAMDRGDRASSSTGR